MNEHCESVDKHIIDERNREMKKIAKDFIDLKEIFSDFHELVKDQGEVVDNIESFVEHAKTNTQDATKTLQIVENQTNDSYMCQMKSILGAFGAGAIAATLAIVLI